MSVYDQHRTAFADVSAYVVLNGAKERVATVAFKHSARSGRVTCFFHVIGAEMQRAFADGGGYDKHSAAAHAATRRITINSLADRPELRATVDAIRAAIKDDGYSWSRNLEDAGFTILEAV